MAKKKKKVQPYQPDKNTVIFAAVSLLLAVLTGLIMPLITEKSAARIYKSRSMGSLK